MYFTESFFIFCLDARLKLAVYCTYIKKWFFQNDLFKMLANWNWFNSFIAGIVDTCNPTFRSDCSRIILGENRNGPNGVISSWRKLIREKAGSQKWTLSCHIPSKLLLYRKARTCSHGLLPSLLLLVSLCMEPVGLCSIYKSTESQLGEWRRRWPNLAGWSIMETPLA